MIQKIFKTFVLILCCSLPLIAQNYKWDAGVIVGGTTYQGDLVETDLYDFNHFNFGWGLFARHQIYPNLNVRGNLVLGRISGNDEDSPDNMDRAFYLNTPLIESSIQFEFDVLGHLRQKNKDQNRRFITPYLFGGIGYAFTGGDINYNEEITSVSFI